MPTCASLAGVERAIGWHDQSNEEEVDQVEDTDSPHDLSCGSGDLFARVVCFGGSKAGKLSSTVSKRCRDKNGTESMEAVLKGGPRRVPGKVSGAFQGTDISYQYRAPM